MVVVVDTQVNCRRAAAAAFQELVGRVGNIQDGLRIVTVADYFALGTRHSAFTTVSVEVARTACYLDPLLDHVMQVKIRHWDASVRELAAQTIARLSRDKPQWMIEEAMPQLLNWVLDKDRCLRHGALMAVASILKSMGEDDQSDASIRIQSFKGQLIKIPVRIEQADYCKGKSGELMREAILHLISSISVALVDLGTYRHRLSKCAN